MSDSKRKTDSPIVVDGIKLSITPDDLDDEEIMDALIAMGKGEGSDDPEAANTAARARHDLHRLMFGDDWERIKSELKEKHGEERNGRKRLRASTVTEFVNSVFEAVNRKNS